MFCILYILPAALILFNESHIIERLSFLQLLKYLQMNIYLMEHYCLNLFCVFLQEAKITNVVTKQVIRI